MRGRAEVRREPHTSPGDNATHIDLSFVSTAGRSRVLAAGIPCRMRPRRATVGTANRARLENTRRMLLPHASERALPSAIQIFAGIRRDDNFVTGRPTTTRSSPLLARLKVRGFKGLTAHHKAHVDTERNLGRNATREQIDVKTAIFLTRFCAALLPPIQRTTAVECRDSSGEAQTLARRTFSLIRGSSRSDSSARLSYRNNNGIGIVAVDRGESTIQ